MAASRGILLTGLLGLLLACGAPRGVCAQTVEELIRPEQRRISIRTPEQIRTVPLPDVPVPVTVAQPENGREPKNLGLDEALGISLSNSEVIRVLSGTGASSSGSTIYDPAVNNTEIDTARAVFDPVISADNLFNQLDGPNPVSDGNSPPTYRFLGTKSEDYTLDFGLSQKFATGATATVGVNAVNQRISSLDTPLSFVLNPSFDSRVSVGLTQPLLKGAGLRANLASIEIARINTERSFFQMKDSVQQMVRGVIEAYWLIMAARVDVWARQQQVKQGREALERAEAARRVRRGDLGDEAQAGAALAGFEVSLIAAQADLLQREAALRNILGLPPADQPHLVPVTPPQTERFPVSWEEILRTAERYRPDLIELKLILEADQQQVVLANNNALPQLDAQALYRWDGLQGRTPELYYIGTEPGQFTGWTLGVNFSVPIGLRAGRAQLRQTELLVMRDKANLEQGLHNASHVLATSYRNLDRYYEQYVAYRKAREATQLNLELQMADWRAGRSILLNALQAIRDWGNAVASEADALALYNSELADLQVQTGTILEAHGIRFVEERYCSIGPMGRLFPDRRYPQAMQPGTNMPQYETTDKPAEEIFHLNEIGSKPSKSPTPVTIPEPQP